MVTAAVGPTGSRRRIQRRTLAVLAAGQVFGGVGVAAGIAVASLVAAELSGSDVVAGAALTAMVVGAAVVAYPLSRLASRRGRRPALVLGYLIGTVGAALAVVAVALGGAALLVVAMLPFGAATAAGLAARFAATDLAAEDARARALAVVIFAVTIGAVLGPNLAAPAEAVARLLGLAPSTGPFLLCGAAFVIAGVITMVALRPDPLLVAKAAGASTDPKSTSAGIGSWPALRAAPLAQLAIAGIVICHFVMVAVMSMTPVHMHHGGAELSVIGFVISLHVAGMYALSPVFGVLADRVGAVRVLTLGAGLLIASCVLAGTAGPADVLQLTAALVTLGLGWSAGLVAGSALVTDAVPLADRAGVQGLSDVAMNVSGALGGVVAGLAVAVSSYAVLGFTAAALVTPFLVVFLLVLIRQARRAVAA
jgi:MFS family permease